MNRYIVGLAALLSIPCLANDNYGLHKQDVYLIGEAGTHEVENIDGNKYGLIFGARNISESGLFYGGEIEVSIYDNDTANEYEGAGAYIPLGKQFKLSENTQINLYGLAGYSGMRVDSGNTHTIIDGLTAGGGVDVNFSDWMLGLRYTKANLDNYNGEAITLTFGRKLQL